MPSSTSSRRPAFARLSVRFAGAAEAERASVRAYDAGALGLEERSDERGVTLILYAPAERALALRGALASGDPAPLALGEIEPVPDTDWSEGWKAGLGASVISERLVVRPSWVAHGKSPGQVEVVIDPGQAFGTGTHPSTWLALEWLDRLSCDLATGARVLDVGTGSGVLAIAAAALSGARVVAFDLDPIAAREARENAARNGCAARVSIFAGGIEALSGRCFELVVANLLRSEALPLLAGLAERTCAGGQAVFSGLLDAEIPAFTEALLAARFTPRAVRRGEDASGERWAALLTVR